MLSERSRWCVLRGSQCSGSVKRSGDERCMLPALLSGGVACADSCAKLHGYSRAEIFVAERPLLAVSCRCGPWVVEIRRPEFQTQRHFYRKVPNSMTFDSNPMSRH